jgi:PAS domain S-box-containing protein
MTPLHDDLRHVLDALPELAWTSTSDGQVDFLNERWCEFTGLSAEQGRSAGWKVAVFPEDLPRLDEYVRSTVTSGHAGEIEARLRRSDGEYRWFLFQARPLRDASGEIVKWYGTSTDIDDRVRAEEALRESEIRHRAIVESIPGLIAVTTPTGTIEYANRQCLEYFGMTREELKALSLGDGIHPDDVHGALAARREALEGGFAFAVEYRRRRADGVYRWFQTRGLPERDAADGIVRWYMLLTDVDDRKRVEAAQKQSAAFLAEAQRVSSTGCFSWRVTTNEFTWSEQAYRIYEVDEAAPLTFDLIATRLHPDDIPVFNELIARARRDGSDWECEQRLRRSDNSIKYLRLVARGVRDPNGHVEYTGAVQDVTERRLSEDALGKVRSELAHVARISTLGVLTASIAHEVNQPLCGIIENSSACLRMLVDDPPDVAGARETARLVIDDGNRAANVIARLRALFTRRDSATEWVNVNEAIQEVVALSQGDIQRERALVRTELAADLPLVRGDRIQLQQVVLNLLRNGIEAMSGVEGRPRQLVIRTECDGGDRVRASVQDAGIGFDIANLERLFEAFHTTKSGMGLGLSVSQSIIQSHDGSLWGAPNDGPGATFGFSIPRERGETAS